MFRLSMSKKYTLTYFDTRGIVETSRLILHYANVDFNDQRFTREQWMEGKIKKGIKKHIFLNN